MEIDNNNENKSTEIKTEEQVPAKKIKRQATQEQLNHPMHGVKLVTVLESLVDHYGWEYLAHEVNINCFKHEPSIKVSLKFLRKMKWAREHVEDMYINMVDQRVAAKGDNATDSNYIKPAKRTRGSARLK